MTLNDLNVGSMLEYLLLATSTTQAVFGWHKYVRAYYGIGGVRRLAARASKIDDLV